MAHFTKQQIEEIRQRLSASAIKDSQLPSAESIGEEDIFAIAQNGTSKKVRFSQMVEVIADILEQDIIETIPSINDDDDKDELVITIDGVQYLVPREKVAAPKSPVLPEGGTFTGNKLITITCPTEGAVIRYNIGVNIEPDDPTATTGIEGNTILLSQDDYVGSDTYYISAVAVKHGLASPVVKAVYSITSITGGVRFSTNITGDEYSEVRFVKIFCDENQDAEIHYTNDGTDPRTSQTAFVMASGEDAIIVPAFGKTSVVLKAYAVKAGWTPSAVSTSSPIYARKIKPVVIEPDGTDYDESRTIYMSCASLPNDDISIHYTISASGVNPTKNSPVYNSMEPPYTVQTVVVRAIAYHEGWGTQSEVTTKTVTVSKAYTLKYGYAGEDIDAEGINALAGTKQSGTVIGTYTSTVTSADAKYLWVCYSKELDINNVTSSNYNIPMGDNWPIPIGEGNPPKIIGNYKCYRSVSAHSVGTTITFKID